MQIEKAVAHWNTHQDVRALVGFVEAEVRKQDEALIRQLADAVELGRKLAVTGGAFTAPELAMLSAATAAVRARLGEKEGT